jgi:hypothetical protein
VSGQGRPKTSKDSSKRKTKTFSPRTGASLNLWAVNAQDKISEIVNPMILDLYNKKNLRSLASSETDELEDLKTKILFATQPFTNINEGSVQESLQKVQNIRMATFDDLKKYCQDIAVDLDKQLTVEDMKQAKASFYSMVYSE